MKITQKIEGIISLRKQRIGDLRKKLNFLQELEGVVENVAVLKAEIISTIQTGNGRFYAIVQNNPEIENRITKLDPESLLLKIKTQIKELEYLVKRFGRENIQISVVGRARQGKSTLLQAISGLKDKVIPASDGTDCTGAKSIICNAEGTFRARVVFYTEKELMEQVQKYMDVLMLDISLGSVFDIEKLKIEDLKQKTTKTASADSRFRHLSKFIYYFKTYKANLGREIEITDQDEVRRYVAQYNDAGKETFDYLAVKEVSIYTPFTYPDAGKIVLVDTIGVGDTSLGIKDKMMETLSYDSDAAIILRRPDPMGDGIREEDNDLFDLIQTHIKDRAVDKWLFYVLNAIGTSNQTISLKMKDLLEEKKKEGALSASFIKIIDCSDKHAVEEELLVPMLDSLTANLSAIDTDFLKRADRTGGELYVAWFSFFKEVQYVLAKDIRMDSNVNLKIYDLFRDIYENELLGTLKASCVKWSADRNTPCDMLDRQFQRITTFNVDSRLPSQEEIDIRLKRGSTTGNPYFVYCEYAHALRTGLTEDFIKIDASLNEVVTHFKDEITSILTENGRLSRIYPINPAYSKSVWLRQFAEDALLPMGLSRLQFAFTFLSDFELSVRGFLIYKIRKHLDILDPDISTQMPDLGSEPNRAIRSALRNRLNTLKESLKRELQNFTQDPNEVFFAVIKEFYDRLAYSSDSEKEWRTLYYENYAMVWKEELKGVQNSRIVFDEWKSCVDKVREYDRKNDFILINGL